MCTEHLSGSQTLAGPDARFREYAKRFDFYTEAAKANKDHQDPEQAQNPNAGGGMFGYGGGRLPANWEERMRKQLDDGNYCWEEYPNGASNYRVTCMETDRPNSVQLPLG